MPRHDPAPAFRALHQPGNPFILANAWDQGSAKVLAALGAEALATTSGGHAFTLGRQDMGTISRDESLAHAAELVTATPLPVSGDFENGFGDAPEVVAETIRLACEVGLAGCSIEDTSFDDDKAYDFEFSVERIKAAVSASRTLPRDFVLVARADGIMNGYYDIDEAIKRLVAFDAAGADCLYAPFPKTIDDLRRIVACTDKPINALTAGPVFSRVTRAQYAEMGVARISLGSALARVTHQALLDAAGTILNAGDMSPLAAGAPKVEIDEMLA